MQPECPCQKQPLTWITVLRVRNTRSGLPGSFLSHSRYRKPFLWSSVRRSLSGIVSRDRISAITFERFSRLKTSMARNRETFVSKQLNANLTEVAQPRLPTEFGRRCYPLERMSVGRTATTSPHKCLGDDAPWDERAPRDCHNRRSNSVHSKLMFESYAPLA